MKLIFLQVIYSIELINESYKVLFYIFIGRVGPPLSGVDIKLVIFMDISSGRGHKVTAWNIILGKLGRRRISRDGQCWA